MIQVYEPPPHIDYLGKDYASFRQLMLDHMSVLIPGWTEQSAADLGNALVELLAYAADQLSYYQDAVATEAYLGTARLRRSVRRHAQLLDYNLHEGCSARVWVQVQALFNDHPFNDHPYVLPKGTQLLTRVVGGTTPGVIIPKSQVYYDALAQQPLVFETMHDAVLHPAHNKIEFQTYGKPATLPIGATRARLRNDHQQLDPPDNTSKTSQSTLYIGDVLIFEEICNPATGRGQDADPEHRHAIRITKVVNEGEAIAIEWHAGDALPFPLVLTADFGGALQDVCVARGNIVLADHGRMIEDEELPPVPDGMRYRPHLRLSGLTYGVQYEHAQAIWAMSATATMEQDSREAMPAISLIELGITPVVALEGSNTLLELKKFGKQQYPIKRWLLRRNLLSSGIFMRDYMVETEDDGLAHLRFGFGEAGWQPAIVGAVLLASYRVGNGTAGNVSRESIAHIVAEEHRLAVRNPLPALGGANAQRTDAARLHAPHGFKTWEPPDLQLEDLAGALLPNAAAADTGLFAPGVFEAQERCVTTKDYADVAMRHPAVAHAIAEMRWSGSWHTAVIYVQRRGDAAVDATFRAALRDFIDPLRMAGYDLDIRPPQFVPLQITLLAHLRPGHRREVVCAALDDTLSNRRLANGMIGFFHPDNYTFGQPVHRSQLIARAMAVTGVAWVDVQEFRRMDSTHDVEHIPTGPLEIARLDNDPRRPENGILLIDCKASQ